MRRIAALAFASLTAAAHPAHAQTPTPTPKPCTAAEHRQFDFWLGQWEVTAQGGVAGTNRIESIQGGCVLLESWTGSGGSTGTSFNMYFPSDRKWHQTWVDNQGGRLDLAGGSKDGKMVLEGQMPSQKDPAKTVLHQITWEPLPDGTVRQIWRASRDGGQKWATLFDGTYSKSKKP
jgi:hypothetical protein